MSHPLTHAQLEANKRLQAEWARVRRVVVKRAIVNLKWKPTTSIGNAIKVSIAGEYNDLLAALRGTR